MRAGLCAMLSGALYCLAMAGFDVWALAFVALVPLLYALEHGPGGHAGAVGLGTLFGVTANAGGFHWLVPTLREFGGFPWALCVLLAVLVWVYQAGHFVLFTWLTWLARRRGHPWLWLAPLFFAAAEVVFPQLFPAYFAASMHSLPHALQALDLGGPTLLAMLLVLANAGLYGLLRGRGARLAALAGALWLVNLAYGAARIAQVDEVVATSPHFDAAIIQADMGLAEKREHPGESLRRHWTLARALEASRPGGRPLGLLVWPETALGRITDPGAIRRGLGAPLLTGAVRSERGPDRQRVFNTAVLVGVDGRITGTYDKTYLLPFGEFIPLAERFPRLQDLSPRSGRFSAGTHQRPLPLGTRRIGVLICYEDIIPGFVRNAVRVGRPQLLVNITNDAWFGDTVEPWTHLGLAKLRAVEHHRYLVRATNSGVSAIVDPVGRLVARGPVFEAATITGAVAWLDGLTAYALLGDWPGWLGLLAVAFTVVPRARTRR